MPAQLLGSIPFWKNHHLKQRNCKGFSSIQRANVPNWDAPSCYPVYVKIHFNSENSLRKEDLEYGSSYAVGEIA